MSTTARKAACIALALALMASVGWLDYRTGYEVSVFALYTFPIAWIAWKTNLAWGLGLSVLGAGEWLWADLADKHPYAHAWIPWERAAMNLLIFGFVAFSFYKFRRDIALGKRKVRQLEGVLPVCIACNRIQDEKGRWINLDDFLRKHNGAQAEQRLCPDCAGARHE